MVEGDVDYASRIRFSVDTSGWATGRIDNVVAVVRSRKAVGESVSQSG